MTDDRKVLLQEVRELREEVKREREENAAHRARIEAATVRSAPLTPSRVRQNLSAAYAAIEAAANGGGEEGGDEDE